MEMVRIYSKDLTVSKEQKHYLLNVMRLKSNDVFNIFNETGEYEMTLDHGIGKKIKEPQPILIKALAFGTIKPHRLRFLLEKSVELGVTHLFPLKTQHSQFTVFKKDRFEKHMIEAVEQCGRIDIPQCFEIQSLTSFIEAFPLSVSWYFGDFEGNHKVDTKEYGFIVGPEGGFSKDEIDLLRQHTKGVQLSKTILRAETAALVSMTFQR